MWNSIGRILMIPTGMKFSSPRSGRPRAMTIPSTPIPPRSSPAISETRTLAIPVTCLKHQQCITPSACIAIASRFRRTGQDGGFIWILREWIPPFTSGSTAFRWGMGRIPSPRMNLTSRITSTWGKKTPLPSRCTAGAMAPGWKTRTSLTCPASSGMCTAMQPPKPGCGTIPLSPISTALL